MIQSNIIIKDYVIIEPVIIEPNYNTYYNYLNVYIYLENYINPLEFKYDSTDKCCLNVYEDRIICLIKDDTITRKMIENLLTKLTHRILYSGTSIKPLCDFFIKYINN